MIESAFTVPTIEFDGHTFFTGGGQHLPFIEMAYRARRGDAIAAELLNKFMIEIYTFDRKVTYWPMQADQNVKVPVK